MLSIQDLTVSVSNRQILQNLHLTARSGEITGIIGKSGSGKSTLFKVILSIPEMISNMKISGNVSWNGLDLSKMKSKPVQPVFQDPFSFFSPYSKLGQSLLEPKYISSGFFISKSELLIEQKRIERLLDRFQLPKSILEKQINQVSGGQLQRLAILRAILANPALILLDEPVTALDALVQVEIVRLIKELNVEQGIGFILVSHDLGLVKHLSDIVYVLHEGHIVESGKALEVFSNPKQEFTKQLIESRDLSRL
jgi:peptide/nickel transport system ATP-binding protein